MELASRPFLARSGFSPVTAQPTGIDPAVGARDAIAVHASRPEWASRRTYIHQAVAAPPTADGGPSPLRVRQPESERRPPGRRQLLVRWGAGSSEFKRSASQ